MPLFKCSASKAKPKNGIRYITDQNKAAFVSAKNLFEDEDYAKQFEETAKRFGKGEKFDERKYYHFKLSCARKNNVRRVGHTILPKKLRKRFSRITNA